MMMMMMQATATTAIVQVEDARAADVTGTFACIDKAAAGLGWKPEVPSVAPSALAATDICPSLWLQSLGFLSPVIEIFGLH